MTAYKGLDRHELSKETQEVEGLQRDLAGEANAATLAKLGFDKIAAELFATNAVLAEAVARREAKRGDREASAGGETTANVRKEGVQPHRRDRRAGQRGAEAHAVGGAGRHGHGVNGRDQPVQTRRLAVHREEREAGTGA